MRTKLYLTPEDHGRALTWDEFDSADFAEGSGYEFIHGRLCVTPLPNFPHDVLRDWVAHQLRAYVHQRPDVLRRVCAPARVFLPDMAEGIAAPEPDIACYAILPEGVPLLRIRWQDISPVLVVEVLSEGQVDKDLGRNRRLYVEVPSIREYWVVDNRQATDRPSLIVFRRRGRRWGARLTVGPGETYTTELLPGFSLVMELEGP